MSWLSQVWRLLDFFTLKLMAVLHRVLRLGTVAVGSRTRLDEAINPCLVFDVFLDHYNYFIDPSTKNTVMGLERVLRLNLTV